MRCDACRVERDGLSPSEAFVLGIMIAGLQDRGRRRKEDTLCDRHARFPHRKCSRPLACQCAECRARRLSTLEPVPRVGEEGGAKR